MYSRDIMHRRRRIVKRIVEDEQSRSHQFHFNIAEVNAMDDQITTDSGTIQSNVDSQNQLQDLTSDQLQQLFTRATSELTEELRNEQEFFKREASFKVPKTSKIINTPFPPSQEDRKEDLDIDIEQLTKLAKHEAGPLIIERYSPNQTQINHRLANISITFNQPMISVSSLDEIKNIEEFGISLTPKLEGRWTWIGTKTVQFEPKHRLSYSTKYTLEVNKELCVSIIEGNSSICVTCFKNIQCLLHSFLLNEKSRYYQFSF